MLRKATDSQEFQNANFQSHEDVWKALMLEPIDYSQKAIVHPITRSYMEKMTFEHGGKEYDEKYPDGIPTSVVITLQGNFFHF